MISFLNKIYLQRNYLINLWRYIGFGENFLKKSFFFRAFILIMQKNFNECKNNYLNLTTIYALNNVKKTCWCEFLYIFICACIVQIVCTEKRVKILKRFFIVMLNYSSTILKFSIINKGFRFICLPAPWCQKNIKKLLETTTNDIKWLLNN